MLFEAPKPSKGIKNSNSEVFSPLVSSIACAIAKTTGHPVTVEHLKRVDGDRNLNIEYQILSEE